MASVGRVSVHVHTRVTSSSDGAHAVTHYHADRLRCRVGAWAYRVAGWCSRIGDRIDPPSDHPL